MTARSVIVQIKDPVGASNSQAAYQLGQRLIVKNNRANKPSQQTKHLYARCKNAPE